MRRLVCGGRSLLDLIFCAQVLFRQDFRSAQGISKAPNELTPRILAATHPYIFNMYPPAYSIGSAPVRLLKTALQPDKGRRGPSRVSHRWGRTSALLPDGLPPA